MRNSARRQPEPFNERRVQRVAISHAIEAVSDALSVMPVDLRYVLRTIVEQARKVAGARYAALGIVADPDRPFEPWVYSGVPLSQAAAIGHFPRPIGLLGAVPAEGKTIRVRDLKKDPRHRGLPPNHPPMHSFLGVPIRYRGESVGNLYLSEKIGAEEFNEEDQWAIELLATHAAVALQVAHIDELREAIEAERARLQTVLESAPYGIVYTNSDNGNLIANPSASELLGRAPIPEAGTSQYAGRILYPDGKPVPAEDLPINRALREQTVRTEELAVLRPDGRRIPVLVGAAPVRRPDGEVIGAISVFQDITPIKDLERLREEWTSVIAHDLRQPVTVITGYVGMLQRYLDRHDAPEGEAKAIGHISSAVRNLDKMIADLLDISRLEARRLTLEQQ